MSNLNFPSPSKFPDKMFASHLKFACLFDIKCMQKCGSIPYQLCNDFPSLNINHCLMSLRTLIYLLNAFQNVYLVNYLLGTLHKLILIMILNNGKIAF